MKDDDQSTVERIRDSQTMYKWSLKFKKDPNFWPSLEEIGDKGHQWMKEVHDPNERKAIFGSVIQRQEARTQLDLRTRLKRINDMLRVKPVPLSNGQGQTQISMICQAVADDTTHPDHMSWTWDEFKDRAAGRVSRLS